MLYALLVILLVLMSVFLIGVVLIQSGRGDGLSGAFGMGEGQAVFGDRAGDVLTKATSWAAILFMLLCLAVTWQSKRSEESLLSGRGSTPRSGSRAPLMTMEEMEEMERDAEAEAQDVDTDEEALPADADAAMQEPEMAVEQPATAEKPMTEAGEPETPASDQ
jgi:preprotein translocase subunit SecG